nr:MAG TPA: hypothetical protein [Caudoviricetes sp.]
MRTMIFTPESKQDLKSILTSQFGGYSYFAGNIRKEDRYVNVSYYFNGDKISIKITYWKDGKDVAVEPASLCSTSTGAINKIAKFLNLK